MAETRWYMVNKDGMATLCADKEDAQNEASKAKSKWPHMAPHRAVQLIEQEHAWGRGDLMATAAVRYCLGRQTYIVGDCANWLIAVWPLLSESARKTIQRDVEEEFTRDDEARERNAAHKPLGADFDRADWERVRALWKE